MEREFYLQGRMQNFEKEQRTVNILTGNKKRTDSYIIFAKKSNKKNKRLAFFILLKLCLFFS